MTADTTTMMTVAAVARSIPGRTGSRRERIHPSTVTRWILAGCPNLVGERVRLNATRVGGRWLVTQDALAEFFAALSSTDASAAPIQKRKRTEAQRKRATEAAARELIRRGA